MKNYFVFLPLVFSVVFLGLFYQQLLGINILIFESLMIGTSFLVNKPTGKNVHAHIVLAGTILSAVFVLLYGSTIAKAINIFSFFFFLGYRCDIQLRSPLYSLLNAVLHLVKIPGIMVRNFLLKRGVTKRTFARMQFYGKIIIFPVLILILFILLYALANTRFSLILENGWKSFMILYEYVIEHFNFNIFFTLLLGLFIAGAYLFQSEDKSMSEIDAHSDDRLLRTKKKGKRMNFKTMDLKKEYQAMLFLLASLNILIAVLNIIDIDWIWINFTWKGSENGAELKQFVHNGTYLLIIAIILSVSIAMYIFRNNINFYARNKWIKLLTYLWLFQNAIMLVSVGMRTYRYVEHFNLAHKRIGLLFFLLAMLVLIITVLVKIRNRRSDYFLVRTTAICSYVILFLLCTVNWDVVIARYNFKHAKTALLHKDWMMTLSDKTLPIIRAHIDIMDDSIDVYSWHYGKSSTYKDLLGKREKEFIAEYRKRGIFSWNYADYKAYNMLDKQNPRPPVQQGQLSTVSRP